MRVVCVLGLCWRWHPLVVETGTRARWSAAGEASRGRREQEDTKLRVVEPLMPPWGWAAEELAASHGGVQTAKVVLTQKVGVPGLGAAAQPAECLWTELGLLP